ncbi:MAG: TetR/AcrR family transcriptional regulator [Sphingomonadales bacterium]
MATARLMKRARSDAQKDVRRRGILNAALELYEDVGLDQVRVDAIAKRAGIAKGTVYLYYKSREGIFIDIYEEAFADWLIGFAKRPELSKSGAKEKIAAIIANHYLQDQRFHELHSGLGQGIWLKLTAREREDALAVLRPGQDAFVDFLSRALNIPNDDADRRAKAVLAMLAGYSQMSDIFGEDPELLTEMVGRQLLGA